MLDKLRYGRNPEPKDVAKFHHMPTEKPSPNRQSVACKPASHQSAAQRPRAVSNSTYYSPNTMVSSDL